MKVYYYSWVLLTVTAVVSGAASSSPDSTSAKAVQASVQSTSAATNTVIRNGWDVRVPFDLEFVDVHGASDRFYMPFYVVRDREPEGSYFGGRYFGGSKSAVTLFIGILIGNDKELLQEYEEQFKPHPKAAMINLHMGKTDIQAIQERLLRSIGQKRIKAGQSVSGLEMIHKESVIKQVRLVQGGEILPQEHKVCATQTVVDRVKTLQTYYYSRETFQEVVKNVMPSWAKGCKAADESMHKEPMLIFNEAKLYAFLNPDATA